MNDNSVKMLLSEYDRLKSLEQSRMTLQEHTLQIYVTIITGFLGLTLWIIEQKMFSGWLICGLSVIFLLFGIIIFIRLLGLDVALAENAKAYNLIRESFVNEELNYNLNLCFLEGIVFDKSRFKTWCSFSGIIHRTINYAQHKTIVTFLNSLIFSFLIVILLHSKLEYIWKFLNIYYLVLICLVSIVISGVLHVAYACKRYAAARNLVFRNQTGYWC